jgi:chromosome segregation ATPase
MDVLLLVLLPVVAAVAVRLNRRLEYMHALKQDISELSAQFTASTSAAQTAVGQLGTLADSAARNISAQVVRAEKSQQELGFLTERAQALSDSVETHIRALRDLKAELDALGASRPMDPYHDAKPQSRAEADLLQALRAGP